MSTSDEIEIMLTGLKQDGMAQAFRDVVSNRGHKDMTINEILARLCISQKHKNDQRALQRRTRAAKLKFDAQPEDIKWESDRGLDRQQFKPLLNRDWIDRNENILLSGSTGTGKTWLACAIANALLRQGITVRYIRTSRILEDMRFAHLDGSIGKLRRSFARPNLLIIDDFGISPIEEKSKEDLFEVLEDRTDTGSTIIAGQLSPSEWHHFLDSEHLADAIMDRVIQRAHTIDLKGESLRERIKSEE